MASVVHRVRSVTRRLFSISWQKMHVSQNNIARTYLVSSFNIAAINNANKISGNNLAKDKDKAVVSCNLVTSSRNFSADKKLTSEEITEKVLHVCKSFDKIPSDKLALESHFMSDLGLDSLDHVELIMNIEDDFNFEIPDADAEKLLRPKDIIEYIVQKEQTNLKQ